MRINILQSPNYFTYQGLLETTMNSYVLLTGGAGYIGSHTALELLRAGENVISFDNYSNSSSESLKRVQKLAGRQLIELTGDVLNTADLEHVFSRYPIKAVVHFAGLKAVGESTQCPLWYYETNVHGFIQLAKVMTAHGVKNLVFSSSATVYGDAKVVPIPESSARSATNPYGQSKLMIELMLEDMAKADPDWNIAILRYFNPVGADSSGLIGEDPSGAPNNLMPFVAQVAVGKRAELNVFGADYSTKDGTGVRDYIHVTDLAKGHLTALNFVCSGKGLDCFNLGTGVGYSVLEIVHAFEAINQVKIPFRVVDRRPGDIAECFSDTSKSASVLGWRAEKTLNDMVRDSWIWQKNNPNGYR